MESLALAEAGIPGHCTHRDPPARIAIARRQIAASAFNVSVNVAVEPSPRQLGAKAPLAHCNYTRSQRLSRTRWC